MWLSGGVADEDRLDRDATRKVLRRTVGLLRPYRRQTLTAVFAVVGYVARERGRHVRFLAKRSVFGVPLVPLLVVASFLAVAWPILWYPNTYTVWFGVDLFIRRPSEEDLSEAERAVQG